MVVPVVIPYSRFGFDFRRLVFDKQHAGDELANWNEWCEGGVA